MRKLWYAGAAVASGLVLFAASPARADDQTSTPSVLPGNVGGAGLLGGLPLLGGLLPSGGQQQSLANPSSPGRSTEGLSMLGDVLPVPGTPTVPDVSGLPGGGMAVLDPADSTSTPATGTLAPATGTLSPATDTLAPATDTLSPATDKPSPVTGKPSPVTGAHHKVPVADPRLHEEPIDPSERTFSPDGRPVAGVDQQFK